MLAILVVIAVAAGVWALAAIVRNGFSARTPPTAFETAVAKQVWQWSVPSRAREQANPVPRDAAAIEDGLQHFADHCAICHGNDGSGDTEIGRHLYPRPPDLRLPATQARTDGELFYIIEEGIRFTGMPAFATGTREGADSSWRLVHFIRHLPSLSPDALERMRALNPKSADEWRQEEAERQFLEGTDDKSPAGHAPAPGHRH